MKPFDYDLSFKANINTETISKISTNDTFSKYFNSVWNKIKSKEHNYYNIGLHM